MKRIIFLGIGIAAAAVCQAKVTLPKFITDNMVVQQNATLTIPGVCQPGADVTVKTDWMKGEAKGKADGEGRFSVSIPTPDAGGPYTIIISDGTADGAAVLSNVLSGEVWVCSGQSNMQFSAAKESWGARLMNQDAVVATSQHPDIRLLQVRNTTSYRPLDDTEVNKGGWVEANPATLDFSAIAYLYALDLHDALGVPVGVIDTSWGGTVAEAWTGYEALEDVPGFDTQLSMLKDGNFTREGVERVYEANLAGWRGNVDAICKQFDKGKMQQGAEWGQISLPGWWEQTVLPGFDGVVWLQRELTLPEAAAGKPLELAVGVVDDRDETYFNGVYVGGFEDPGAQRKYTVPGNLVKAGKNVITVKVIDFMGDGGIKAGSDMSATVDGASYPLSGEWNYCKDLQADELPGRPASPNGPNFPTVLYNAMIHPLRVLPVKGVIWYQGCANVGRAGQYEPLFKSLIKNWRTTFGNPDMRFYFVQLAGWLGQKNVQPESEWALLRDSQAKALELPNTGMAVAIDLGNPADIHPANKQEVARRLSLIALNRDYGHDEIVYCAPSVVSSRADGNRMVLKFNGAVKPTSCALTGFIIGDANGKFAYANARLEGEDTIVVSSPLIERPTAVRYNWADYPGGNLYGTTGLPVAPFATDKP